jgi:hypothetical protein
MKSPGLKITIIMKATVLHIILFLLLVITGSNCRAQGFFNQKGAWIKNQLKQIALWEIYIKDLEKGYNIAKEGLKTISDIKNGDFHLHLDHFDAYMAINPGIKKYSKAIEILLLQLDIKKLYPKTDDAYVNSIFTHLIDGAASDVDQLNMLLSPGNYSMKDDERIKQIDKLYLDMKDKYAFARSFADDIKLLSLQQLKEKNEVKTSRLLNNIKTP